MVFGPPVAVGCQGSEVQSLGFRHLGSTAKQVFYSRLLVDFMWFIGTEIASKFEAPAFGFGALIWSGVA